MNEEVERSFWSDLEFNPALTLMNSSFEIDEDPELIMYINEINDILLRVQDLASKKLKDMDEGQSS